MTNKELLVHTLNFIKENPHKWNQRKSPDTQIWPSEPLADNFATCFGGWLLYFSGMKSLFFHIGLNEELDNYLTLNDAYWINTSLSDLETIVNEYPD